MNRYEPLERVNMSLLHYNLNAGHYANSPQTNECDVRYERDIIGDLKHGLDLVFELKKKIDALHPIASETLVRLLSM